MDHLVGGPDLCGPFCRQDLVRFLSLGFCRFRHLTATPFRHWTSAPEPGTALATPSTQRLARTPAVCGAHLAGIGVSRDEVPHEDRLRRRRDARAGPDTGHSV